jgi:hypothetical protein
MFSRLGLVLDAPGGEKCRDCIHKSPAPDFDHCDNVPEWFVRLDTFFNLRFVHHTTILKRTGNDLNLTEYVRGWKVCETKCEKEKTGHPGIPLIFLFWAKAYASSSRFLLYCGILSGSFILSDTDR